MKTPAFPSSALSQILQLPELKPWPRIEGTLVPAGKVGGGEEGRGDPSGDHYGKSTCCMERTVPAPP